MTSTSEDPFRKQVKLDHTAVAGAASHETVSENHTDAHECNF